MQKFFVFFLPAKTVVGMRKRRRRLIFAVIIKTLIPNLKRAKQRSFMDDRDVVGGRERESEQPSIRPSAVREDAKLWLNVLKLRDFCCAQMYHMTPGLPCTPTHT